jgi:hypothetical protein
MVSINDGMECTANQAGTHNFFETRKKITYMMDGTYNKQILHVRYLLPAVWLITWFESNAQHGLGCHRGEVSLTCTYSKQAASVGGTRREEAAAAPYSSIGAQEWRRRAWSWAAAATSSTLVTAVVVRASASALGIDLSCFSPRPQSHAHRRCCSPI